MICFAHRGARGYAPENTLAAIRKALEMGAPWIEIDVHQVEGRLVVIHGPNLEKTTNGHGAIASSSLKELRSLDAGGGEQIPFLEEVLDCIDRRAGLNIEIKSAECALLVARQIELRVAHGWALSRFLVSSFDYQELRSLRALSTTLPIGVLVEQDILEGFKVASELQAVALHPYRKIVTSEIVARAHEEKLMVNVYTVNERNELERMRSIGVDGVFCDYPDRVTTRGVEGEKR